MVDRYDEELFLEYVEGELPHEKRVAFENQMLQDPRLRNLVAQMVLDRHRLRTLPDEAPPAHLMDAVHERLERAMLLGAGPETFSAQSHTTLRGFRWRRFATLAAMAAMFAVVAGVFVVTLVTLSNDAPIRQTGPASLISPGLFGGTPTLPPSTKPPVDSTPVTPAETATLPAATDATAAPSPAATVGVESEPVDSSLATPAAAEAAPVDVPPALPPRPAADLVMRVTARDLAASQRRLNGWVLAYEVKVLDQRQEQAATTPTTANPPDAAGGANQPLRVEGEQTASGSSLQTAADQVVASVTLSLPQAKLSHLRTFISSLPGTAVEELVSTPAASGPISPIGELSPAEVKMLAGAGDDYASAMVRDMLREMLGQSYAATETEPSAVTPLTPPLILEHAAVHVDAAPITPPPLPDPVTVRVEWVQR